MTTDETGDEIWTVRGSLYGIGLGSEWEGERCKARARFGGEQAWINFFPYGVINLYVRRAKLVSVATCLSQTNLTEKDKAVTRAEQDGLTTGCEQGYDAVGGVKATRRVRVYLRVLARLSRRWKTLASPSGPLDIITVNGKLGR